MKSIDPDFYNFQYSSDSISIFYCFWDSPSKYWWNCQFLLLWSNITLLFLHFHLSLDHFSLHWYFSLYLLPIDPFWWQWYFEYFHCVFYWTGRLTPISSHSIFWLSYLVLLKSHICLSTLWLKFILHEHSWFKITFWTDYQSNYIWIWE